MAKQVADNASVNSGIMASSILGNSYDKGVKRGTDGKWLPGSVPNPSGRPKSRLISEAFRRILDDKGADEIAATVYRDAISATKGSDRHAAAEMIRDTIEGKPVQSMRIEASIDVNLAQSLATLASQINIAIVQPAVMQGAQAPQLDSTKSSK